MKNTHTISTQPTQDDVNTHNQYTAYTGRQKHTQSMNAQPTQDEENTHNQYTAYAG